MQPHHHSPCGEALLRRVAQLHIPGLAATVIAVSLWAAPSPVIAGDAVAMATLDPETPIQGKLVIAGGGKLPETVAMRFMELAGGKDARLVVIPTAGVDENALPDEHKLDLWRALGPASVCMLHATTREIADDPEFSKPLKEATGVWFTGGSQWRVIDTYLNTLVEKQLRGLLDRGGVVGGSSAGAAVMSPVMIRKGKPAVEVGQGFGFLPGTVVDQHFTQRHREGRLIGVLGNHPGHVGLGIDEQTAVIVQGRELEVMGESQVTAYLNPSGDRPMKVEYLKNGDRADLVELYRAAVARTVPLIAMTTPPALEVKHGTLVIVGGGALPREVVDRFIQAAGGPDAPLVVVTTAEGETAPAEEDAIKFLLDAGAKHVSRIHAVKPRDADKEEVLGKLREAKGVWFGGGRQWRLVDAYLGTKAEGLFHDVLRRGGVIGGSSAGATIQASYLVRGSPINNTIMMAEGYEQGFGFLPGAAIDQHFTQRNRFNDMKLLKRAHPELLGLGIDEGTAAIISGHTLEVVGRHQISVFDRRGREPEGDPHYVTLDAGDRYDLKVLDRVEKATASATSE